MRRAALCLLCLLGLLACNAPPVQPPQAGLPADPDAPPLPAPPPPNTSSAIAFATLTVPDKDQRQQPLAVELLEVTVHVEGRLARTEVKQVFRNHLSQQSEGVYTFQLPEGASISRLQMDVEGQMVEGELVERERARQIYEGIVQRRKDPALLEWQGGERFQTSLFPIPAQGTKTVILTYEALLPASQGRAAWRYDLPRLAGDAKEGRIKRFSFALEARDAGTPHVSGYDAQIQPEGQEPARVSLDAQDFAPAGPLEITFARGALPAASLRAARRDDQGFFLADLIPQLPRGAQDPRRDLVVLVDSSAGLGQAELRRAGWLASALLHDLPPERRFVALYGDLHTHRCAPDAQRAKEKDKAYHCLMGLDAGGATDLGQMLEAAAAAAGELGDDVDIVLLTDGVASVGELDADLLRAQWRRARGERGWRLHTVAVGHSPDAGFLARLARESQGHSLRVTPDQPVEAAREELSWLLASPLLTDLRVTALSGELRDLVPAQEASLPWGAPLAIMGRLDKGPARLLLEAQYQGQALRQELEIPDTASARDGLLPGFWARARIGDLQDQQTPREHVVALSKEFGVMSRYTSFLVLENEEAYQRFQVERRQEARRVQEQARDEQRNLEKSNKNLQDLINDAKKDEAKAAEKPEPKPADEDPEEVLAEELRSDGKLEAPKKKAKDIGRLQQELGTLNGDGEREEEDPAVATGNTRLGVLDGADGVLDPAHGSNGIGGLGIRGSGSGGGGVGEGFGRSGILYEKRPAAPPQITQGSPTVTGSIDHNIIRVVVRRHQSQLRYCYERALRQHPNLAGRIMLRWTILADGRVGESSVISTTLRNAEVEECVMRVARRWAFPALPGGGVVTVNFPFVFSHDGSAPPAAAYDALAGRVQQDAPALIQGHLPRQEADELLRAHLHELRACVRQTTSPKNQQTGALHLKLSLSPDGAIAAAQVSGHDGALPALEACFVKAAKGWQGPSHQAAGVIGLDYTLSYGPGALYVKKEHAQRRAALEAQRKQHPEAWGARAELLELLLEAHDHKAARQLWDEALAEVTKSGETSHLLWLLRRELSLDSFAHEAASPLWARMQRHYAGSKAQNPQPIQGLAEKVEEQPEQIFPWLARYYAQADRGDDLAELVALPGAPREEIARVLRALSDAGHDEVLLPAVRALRAEGGWDAATRFALLRSMPSPSLQPERLAASRALLQDERWGQEAMQLTLALTPEAEREALFPALAEGCLDRFTYEIPFCDEAATGFAGGEALRGKLPGRRLAEAAHRRRQDMGNSALIGTLIALRMEAGERDGDALRRLRSEVVEFSPHDHAARMQYARWVLEQEADLERGCQQIASAVQLNPAQRDTFREIVKLRRQHEDQAEPLRRCLVDGVSGLPVQRRLSLVLTWEDPTADVDLHIHEANGEHVWYSDRESEQGGLLYYDITDGYGPEIYVLGSAAKGTYKLSVIYYSGLAKDLKGTLTVLRDAGTDREQRQDFPFTLREANREVPYDLTALEL